MTATLDAWPAGATWAFQGTVASDATAGTHVAKLTVSPGAGQEMLLIGAMVNTKGAAAQLLQAFVDDGSNVLFRFIRGLVFTDGQDYSIPQAGSGQGTIGANPADWQGTAPLVISGTMRVILWVETSTVSQTQTFSMVCRLKSGQLPATATLSDTVGTPTLTTNTNAVF